MYLSQLLSLIASTLALSGDLFVVAQGNSGMHDPNAMKACAGSFGAYQVFGTVCNRPHLSMVVNHSR
jgi:hypothetical protein